MQIDDHPRPGTTWRLFNLRLAPLEAQGLLVARAAAELGLEVSSVRGLRIARKALDARRRRGQSGLEFVCHVDLVLDEGLRTRAMARLERSGALKHAPKPGSVLHARPHPSLFAGAERRPARAVVVGSGPAGLFAAWVLSHNGVRTTLIERGPILRERARALARFHQSRTVDPERTLLFGEGGAGT
jgi:uncharacterized FAD-dependent dehydrogenase